MDADFHWPAISIGNTLDAIRFATTNKNYLLLNGLPDINSFDLSGSLTLEESWAALAYGAYNSALLPFAAPLQQIRVEDDSLVVRTSEGSHYRVAFDALNIFTTNNVVGVEKWLTRQFCYNKVVDWYDVERGGEETYQLTNNVDPSIKKVSFYRSARVDGREYYDLYSVSHLGEDQLVSHEYSDTATRFKIQKMAKSLNKSVVLKFWKRDIYKIYDIAYNGGAPENINWMGEGREAH